MRRHRIVWRVYWLGVAFGIALLAMLLTKGSLVRLLGLPIQSLWLLVVGLGIQIALWVVDVPADRVDDLGFALLMLSYALLLAFCLVNIRVRGMAIIAIGVAMNAVVTGLNEGMPTREEEVETRSGRTVDRPIERTATERPESDDDLLPFFGQIIRLPENPVDEALAPGDLVIAAGMVVVFVAGGRRRRRRGAVDTPAEERPAEAAVEEEALETVEAADEPAEVAAVEDHEPVEEAEPVLEAEAVDIPDDEVAEEEATEEEATEEEVAEAAAKQAAAEEAAAEEAARQAAVEAAAAAEEAARQAAIEEAAAAEEAARQAAAEEAARQAAAEEAAKQAAAEAAAAAEEAAKQAAAEAAAAAEDAAKQAAAEEAEPEPEPAPPPPPRPRPRTPAPPPPPQPAPTEPATPAPVGTGASEWEVWQAELRSIAGDLDEQPETGDDAAT